MPQFESRIWPKHGRSMQRPYAVPHNLPTMLNQLPRPLGEGWGWGEGKMNKLQTKKSPAARGKVSTQLTQLQFSLAAHYLSPPTDT